MVITNQGEESPMMNLDTKHTMSLETSNTEKQAQFMKTSIR